jgi:hypothetical protein
MRLPTRDQRPPFVVGNGDAGVGEVRLMSSHLAFKLDLTSCVSPGAVRTAVQGSSRAFADLVLVGLFGACRR